MYPKVIAFYLPQFHAIPENDEWWGEGFTDWISSKNAKPLFPWHNQPRIPAHNNYYNLLDINTIRWQADLAKKAGIYGFCVYHYWFGANKLLLEKPMENLLKNEDVDFRFCFSWANESWVASWSNIRGNAWTNSGNNTNRFTPYLMKQEYGDKSEWKEHFDYLLPFFKDKRYIKKDGKPVFVIYHPHEVLHLKRMIDYWNEIANENGFDGLFIVGTNCVDRKRKYFDATILYEPMYTIGYDSKYKNSLIKKYEIVKNKLKDIHIELPYIASYRRTWTLIVKRITDKSTYLGGFVGFDASPRKGKSAKIFVGSNPKLFEKFFGMLYRKSVMENKEFLFITAWNEWGEGAYIEPDSKFGFGYLNAIRKIIKKYKK